MSENLVKIGVDKTYFIFIFSHIYVILKPCITTQQLKKSTP